ncbi:acyl-CoA synthetase [Microbacterium sp. LRZ72]|uniref:acyl-CoA synthetase n=1 Tax=Microbacterium sp. LRZ72 TaxID=2942481 RepID=UPI00299F9C8A|nr:acyl-CoA synthetase [Microbacterium sp. LRZ72]MDX2376153.1 acyl-CoA synthetase [Microbacterium sp. LRZ72]
MTTPSPIASASHASSARFAPRHVQLARAVAAAIAALMITFTPDHSAAVGLAVFSGFGILTALVLLLAAWLTYGSGQRGMPILLGVLALIAGMAAGVGPWRTDVTFYVVVIAWALTTGIAEVAWGWRGRRAVDAARDHLAIGILTLVLAAALLVIPAGYSLEYTIEAAGTFTLTGTTIAVGVFGGYAAIVAVYLAIAGFSPRPSPSPSGDLGAGGEPAPRREGSA